MNTPPTINGMTADELINTSVEENTSGTAILYDLEKRKEELTAEEQALVDQYRNGMHSVLTTMDVDNLGGNTAGLYDGSEIFIDKNIIMVGQDINTTIEQSKEVERHEKYHQDNNHLAPMVTYAMADTHNSASVVIAGRGFDETEFIEGLTVSRTGDRFVSAEYVEYKENLESAAAQAGVSLGEIEQAVAAGDLTRIDDRAKEEEPAKEHQAIAA
nr:hypothetical protein [uncultured bacterium]